MILAEKNITNSCAIIVLAAGGSTRLGKPKQLLQYKGSSLLQHTMKTAINSAAGPVVVVTGSDADLITAQVNGMSADIVDNTAWQNGMASSIVCGLNYLLSKFPEMEEVIFMMSDQPFVNESLLHDLQHTRQQTQKPIVASGYNDTVGVPALFTKIVFSKLLQLTGDAGARKILQLYATDVATVPFPLGNIDIDTAEDYEKLLQGE